MSAIGVTSGPESDSTNLWPNSTVSPKATEDRADGVVESAAPDQTAAGVAADTVEISAAARAKLAEQSAAAAFGTESAAARTAESTASVPAEVQNLSVPTGSAEETQPLWKSVKELSSLLGLRGARNHKELAAQLESKLKQTRARLQTRINEILDDQDLELAADERLNFTVDNQGYIKVGGLEDKEKLAQIEKALNADEGLAKDLRTFAAQQAALPMIRRGLIPDQATRRTLMAGFLAGEGLDLDSLDASADGQALLQSLGLSDSQIAEIAAVQRPDAEPDQTQLEFQNGTLVNPEAAQAARAAVADLFDKVRIEHPVASTLVDALNYFNDLAAGLPGKDDQTIDDFTFRFDENGWLKVDREGLNYGDAGMIDSWFGEEFTTSVRSISEELLVEHEAEHGDVEQYAHEVVFQVDALTGVQAEIRSPEADQAARAEIESASQGLAGELNSYLADPTGLPNSPLFVEMNESGRLRLSDPQAANAQPQVKQVLDLLNLALSQDNPDLLPNELKDAFAQVQTIQKAMDKIHDPDQKKAAFMLGGS